MNEYRIWLDDTRDAPDGFISFRSVSDVRRFILNKDGGRFYLDLDHDLGKYAVFHGGDGIELIKFLILCGYNDDPAYEFKFNLHTMNPVGRENMQALIDRYFAHEKEGC